MAMKELYFASALTIGMGPGEAVQVRPGEVLGVPGDLVKTLLRRPGVVEAGPNHTEARRVTLEERRMPKELARLVSPPLDEDRLISDYSRRKAATALRKEIDSVGNVPAPKA